MYIFDVKVINYRNLSDFKVSLNEGLSIIIGENNGGKSNFLEALNLIFNNHYSLRKRTLEQDDFWNGVAIKDTCSEIVIEAIIKGINSEDELAITSRWLTRNPSEAKLTYKFRPKMGIEERHYKWTDIVEDVALNPKEDSNVVYPHFQNRENLERWKLW